MPEGNPLDPAFRTTRPTVTGGSVVALKYNGGILVATDCNASYGSMAMFENVVRMSKVGMAGDTLLAAGGDYSDYQQMLKMIEARAVSEYNLDDGASLSPSMMHQWLSRIMYQRRSKMDPLWNSIVVAGFRGGKSYLGTTDLYGTMYEEEFLATGFGQAMALPLLRSGWKPSMSEEEATTLLKDCMRVLFYRDCRASSKFTIGKACASGVTVSPITQLETYWEYPEFVRPGPVCANLTAGAQTGAGVRAPGASA